MQDERISFLEQAQKLLVRIVATHPAGHGLCLIGGFRYRFLDGSVRRSLDVDYHWDGDLAEKQTQLLMLFQRRLLPETRQRWEYQGTAAAATGPGADSPAARVIDLAFWQDGVAGSRIEIPVDITRLICMDRPIVRTADGVVYRTPSDQDMIEGKVIAIFSRTNLEHRDLLDLFLFADHLGSDSSGRVQKKLQMANASAGEVRERLADMVDHRRYHVRTIGEILATQFDPPAADSVRAAGGADSVFDVVLDILRGRLRLGREVTP